MIKNLSKIKTIAITAILCLVISLIITSLPFLCIYFAINTQSISSLKNWSKLGVSSSIFPYQKKYTLDFAIPTLFLTKDYKSVVKYAKRFEKTNLLKQNHFFFISEAFIQLDDYENALFYAKKSEFSSLELKIYLKMKDVNNSKILFNKISKTRQHPINNLYKAQIAHLEGNNIIALSSINKYLQQYPNNISAMKTKAEILKALNKTKEYEDYNNKIITIEKRNNGKFN